MGTPERSPVIYVQTVAQSPNMRCIGDVGVIYCDADLVAGYNLDEPSTVLIVKIVCWVVGASNKTRVMIPVKVAICCVHSIVAVASLITRGREMSLS